MSLNLTAAWLEAKLSPAMIQFSAQIQASSTFLNGPGGLAGDGFPLPHGGLLRRLALWDGNTMHTVSEDIPFGTDDRIAMYATYEPGSGTFSVAVLKNFASTPLSLSGITPNAPYYASVEMLLKEDA